MTLRKCIERVFPRLSVFTKPKRGMGFEVHPKSKPKTSKLNPNLKNLGARVCCTGETSILAKNWRIYDNALSQSP